MIVSPILFLANVVRRAYGRRRTVESLPHERGVDQTPATNIAGVGPTSESGLTEDRSSVSENGVNATEITTENCRSLSTFLEQGPDPPSDNDDVVISKKHSTHLDSSHATPSLQFKLPVTDKSENTLQLEVGNMEAFWCSKSRVEWDFYSHEFDTRVGGTEEMWKGLFRRLNNMLEFSDPRMELHIDPECQARNRYRNIVPYTGNRVQLLEGNDYINASYVSMEALSRHYILTQGPMDNTIGHFWQMVWEQKSVAIVMLCKCTEGGRDKCAHYWPIEQGKQFYFSCYVITCHSITWKASYQLYSLELFNLETEQTRMIQHYHYISWPDFGVPQDPMDFLTFLMDARRCGVQSGEQGPLIVHCSAGVGRSGVFTLTDVCIAWMEEARSLETLDVPQLLLHLRKQRLGLVQTPEQLQFAYVTILNAAHQSLGLGKGIKNLQEEVEQYMMEQDETPKPGLVCAQLDDSAPPQPSQSHSAPITPSPQPPPSPIPDIEPCSQKKHSILSASSHATRSLQSKLPIIDKSENVLEVGNMEAFWCLKSRVEWDFYSHEFDTGIGGTEETWKGLYRRLDNMLDFSDPGMELHIDHKCYTRIRYRNIAPYTGNRVQLLKGNDYINASYVSMEALSRHYILTQAPMDNTISHFWQMVWEQKSVAVVMLCNYTVGREYKCAHYWPMKEKRLFFTDCYRITCHSITRKASYCVSSLKLLNMETGQTRMIQHYRYLSWPDFGVPQDPMDFLTFLMDARRFGVPSGEQGPLIVHCGAGAGPSGVFTLTDVCIAWMEEERSLETLDIQQLLLQLRKQRVGLVQTPEQLQFAYITILNAAHSILGLGQSIENLQEEAKQYMMAMKEPEMVCAPQNDSAQTAPVTPSPHPPPSPNPKIEPCSSISRKENLKPRLVYVRPDPQDDSQPPKPTQSQSSPMTSPYPPHSLTPEFEFHSSTSKEETVLSKLVCVQPAPEGDSPPTESQCSPITMSPPHPAPSLTTGIDFNFSTKRKLANHLPEVTALSTLVYVQPASGTTSSSYPKSASIPEIKPRCSTSRKAIPKPKMVYVQPVPENDSGPPQPSQAQFAPVPRPICHSPPPNPGIEPHCSTSQKKTPKPKLVYVQSAPVNESAPPRCAIEPLFSISRKQTPKPRLVYVQPAPENDSGPPQPSQSQSAPVPRPLCHSPPPNPGIEPRCSTSRKKTPKPKLVYVQPTPVNDSAPSQPSQSQFASVTRPLRHSPPTNPAIEPHCSTSRKKTPKPKLVYVQPAPVNDSAPSQSSQSQFAPVPSTVHMSPPLRRVIEPLFSISRKKTPKPRLVYVQPATENDSAHLQPSQSQFAPVPSPIHMSPPPRRALEPLFSISRKKTPNPRSVYVQPATDNDSGPPHPSQSQSASVTKPPHVSPPPRHDLEPLSRKKTPKPRLVYVQPAPENNSAPPQPSQSQFAPVPRPFHMSPPPTCDIEPHSATSRKKMPESRLVYTQPAPKNDSAPPQPSQSQFAPVSRALHTSPPSTELHSTTPKNEALGPYPSTSKKEIQKPRLVQLARPEPSQSPSSIVCSTKTSPQPPPSPTPVNPPTPSRTSLSIVSYSSSAHSLNHPHTTTEGLHLPGSLSSPPFPLAPPAATNIISEALSIISVESDFDATDDEPTLGKTEMKTKQKRSWFKSLKQRLLGCIKDNSL